MFKLFIKIIYLYESNFEEFIMFTALNKQKVDEIEESRKRIRYYKRIISSTLCPQSKLYFENAMLQVGTLPHLKLSNVTPPYRRWSLEN